MAAKMNTPVTCIHQYPYERALQDARRWLLAPKILLLLLLGFMLYYVVQSREQEILLNYPCSCSTLQVLLELICSWTPS